jgi:hypothetical protein
VIGGVDVAVVSYRRTASRLTLLSVLFGLFLWVPGAFALDTMVDTPVGGAAAAVDATVPDPVAVSPAPVAPVADPVPVTPDPVVVAPDPVPVVPDPTVVPDPVPVAPDPVAVAPAPVAIVPDPAPVAPPDPIAVVAPVDPAPPPANPAPPTPDVTVAVHDASTVAGSVVTDAIAVTVADTGTVVTRLDVGDPTATGVANAIVPTTASASGQPATESSIITPLVVPIVQTLGSGLLAPYVRPETFGPQASQPNKTGAPPAAPAPMPERPAQASSVTSFGIAVPTGGWSGHSAGILALLMGLLPLGLPDGKSALGGPTQLAVLLVGGLLMLVPFFTSFIRDDRRRGPRGFAALALRPG